MTNPELDIAGKCPIGLSTYIEVIQVTPLIGATCIPNISLGISLWQNPINRFDVNGDGIVDTSDYNSLVDYINTYGSGKLPKVRAATMPYVDVDGDGYVNNHDLAQLAEWLINRRTVDKTPEQCYAINDFQLQRDLLDPSKFTIVKQVAAAKNILPTADYAPYLRNLKTNAFTLVTYNRSVSTRDSYVFIHKSLIAPPSPYAPGCEVEPCIFRLLRERLRKSEIMPSRFNVERITTSRAVVPQRIAIIAIYDEADLSYVGTSQETETESTNTYNADRIVWEDLMGRIRRLDAHVRLGLLQSAHYKNTGELWDVLCPTCVLPGDTDRALIDHTILMPNPGQEVRSPRLTTGEILDAVDLISQDGYIPSDLVFLLDNSGSIRYTDYKPYLETAKAKLQTKYPSMRMEDQITSRPERWLQFSIDAVNHLFALAGVSV